MSKYKLVSGKEVLARISRAFGGKLPSMYHDDILEWISEGLGMMQVTATLVISSTPCEGEGGAISVCNYCADLPCGFVNVIAVENCYGMRLPEGGNQMNRYLDNRNWNPRARVSSFEVSPYSHQTSDGLPTDEAGVNPPYYLDGSDLSQTDTNDHTNDFYQIRGNKIQVSFESGFLRMHYYSLPTGEDGYPLIPDNENFKEGLMWHVVKRLIGAGYEHKVFNYTMADNQATIYMERGMSEVSFYTPEGAARLNKSFVTLIPAPGYRDEFFGN